MKEKFLKKIRLSSSNIALYGAETWTLREMYQKHLEGFEMWC